MFPWHYGPREDKTFRRQCVFFKNKQILISNVSPLDQCGNPTASMSRNSLMLCIWAHKRHTLFLETSPGTRYSYFTSTGGLAQTNGENYSVFKLSQT